MQPLNQCSLTVLIPHCRLKYYRTWRGVKPVSQSHQQRLAKKAKAHFPWIHVDKIQTYAL